MSLTDSNAIMQKPVTSLLLAVLLIAAILLPSHANAIDRQDDLPIDIASDSATINDENGVATYSGNVIVSQGQTRLEADTVSVYMKDQTLERIEADGRPARFQEQQLNETVPTTGHASTIVFESSKATLTFKGEATLNQASNSFSGEQIVYDINAQAIQAKGDDSGQSRVKIQYLPGTPAVTGPSTSGQAPAQEKQAEAPAESHSSATQAITTGTEASATEAKAQDFASEPSSIPSDPASDSQ